MLQCCSAMYCLIINSRVTIAVCYWRIVVGASSLSDTDSITCKNDQLALEYWPWYLRHYHVILEHKDVGEKCRIMHYHVNMQ